MTRIALVTGASVGIGEATVRRLVADGWKVIAAARRTDRLAALAAELGEAVLPWTLDMGDAQAVAAVPSSLPAGWQVIDLLVNNAGLALGREAAQASSLADMERMIDTNVTGLVRCTQALLPGMVARGRGHVVNVGSIAGHLPYPGGHVYGGSKAFVHQYTLGLKSDLVGTGVRATVVEPGMVGGSEFSQVRFHGDQQKAQAIYTGVDALEPGDVAEAIAWVAAQPPRVNITVLQLMPVDQGPGPTIVHRQA
jgi:3-hydroxy acid dehydrogenase / malonic semialdehyde reductase